MTATEAITYCLRYVHDTAEDGDYCSQAAYDRNGDPHWIAWRAAHGKDASPEFHSGSPTPFAAAIEPYTTNRDQKEQPT